MMTIEEAIKTALEYENRVRNVYQDAVGRATDAVGKRIFQILADEEHYHVEYLQNRLEEWLKTGKVTRETINTVIPPKEGIADRCSDLARHTAVEDRETEVELLKKALEVETETGNFYRELVSRLPGEEQKMFARFLEIEEGHRALVQAEIDSVTGMGFWFDIKEFDLEAA